MEALIAARALAGMGGGGLSTGGFSRIKVVPRSDMKLTWNSWKYYHERHRPYVSIVFLVALQFEGRFANSTYAAHIEVSSKVSPTLLSGGE